MATFVLIPGAGSGPWSWHPVTERLERRGHHVVPVELPLEDDDAGLDRYTEATLAAIEAAGTPTTDELVVVGQSMGALTAPLVAERTRTRLLVLVCPMIPAPGETGGDWWTNVSQREARLAFAAEQGRPADEDELALFTHDWPAELVAESEQHGHGQSGRPFEDPWPLDRWPDVPTRVVLGTDDRCFAPALIRRLSQERLGLEPDEVESGHVPALGNPDGLVALLEGFLCEVGIPPVRAGRH